MIPMGNLDLGHLISTLSYSHSKNLYVVDNFLLDHVGLPHVLVLTVHLVNLLGWMGKGDHSRYLATLLLKVRVN